MSDELIKRIKERCSGRARWYVMNTAEDGYCIDFGFKQDADEWMSRYMRENPGYITRNGYHIVERRFFTAAEELANEAADLIEQQAEAIKGAAIIADAAGAEIRALKSKVEARAGEAVSPNGIGMTFDEWACTYADAIPIEGRRAAWQAARASIDGESK